MVLILKVAILTWTLALAMGSQHHIINKDIEALLVNLNNFLASKKIDSSLLPDIGVDGTPIFFGTTVRDLTTIYRTGDCELWVDGDNLKIKMNVGLKNMTLHVFLVPYLGGPGTYSVDGANVEVGFTLKSTEPRSCTTDWDYLNITTLGNIQTHSFNAVYDGQWAPKDLSNILISYYNKYLNYNEIFSIKNLNLFINICEPALMPHNFRKYEIMKMNKKKHLSF